LDERRVGIFALVGALALVGLNIGFKDVPDRKQVEQTAESLLDQRRWLGRYAPQFELTLTDGRHLSVGDLAGKKVLILNFWATWCGPCRKEMPELDRYAKSMASADVVLIGIDVEESSATVAAFLKENPVSFPIGIDAKGEIARAYGVTSYPTTVVVGVDGRVALYETSAILNANVSLDDVVRSGLEGLRKGRGVSKETYLKGQETERPTPRAVTKESGDLEGRAKRIAENMPCPCGCDDKLSVCTCATAKKVKAALRKDAFGDKADAAIMEELNKQYCMKGMGS
jgi:cytochrome c biogenesis protein CcmG/thiol:disulfide interchange protein DsbE